MADELNQTQDAPEPPDDLRSVIGAAFDQAAAPETPETPKPAPEAVERHRDEAGRFAKAEQAPAVSAEPEPSEPASPPGQTQDPEVSKATARWSAADRDMLGKIPSEARDFVLRRHREMEADHTRKTQEIAKFKGDYEPIAQMLAPHDGAMRRAGFTPATLIQTWMNVEQGLMQGGQGAEHLVAEIVRGYKLNPVAVARAMGVQPGVSHAGTPPPEPQSEGGQPQLPPEVAEKLTAMERWIAQQENTTRQRQQAEYNATAHRVMTDIERFASETDSSGALLRPHFHEVENDMAVLAAAWKAHGRQPVLSELYDQAVWSNPSTRAKLQADQTAAAEAQRAAAEKQRQDEARAKAERARRAASSVTGSPSAGQPGTGGDSIRAILEAQYDRVSAGV